MKDILPPILAFLVVAMFAGFAGCTSAPTGPATTPPHDRPDIGPDDDNADKYRPDIYFCDDDAADDDNDIGSGNNNSVDNRSARGRSCSHDCDNGEKHHVQRERDHGPRGSAGDGNLR